MTTTNNRKWQYGRQKELRYHFRLSVVVAIAMGQSWSSPWSTASDLPLEFRCWLSTSRVITISGSAVTFPVDCRCLIYLWTLLLSLVWTKIAFTTRIAIILTLDFLEPFCHLRERKILTVYIFIIICVWRHAYNNFRCTDRLSDYCTLCPAEVTKRLSPTLNRYSFFNDAETKLGTFYPQAQQRC